MKVIVLDYDGVLVPFTTFDKKTRPAIADPGCIERLNKLVALTGANVVISSDWRTKSTVEALQRCMDKWGFIGKVIAKTPKLVDRSDEILAWLSTSKSNGIHVEAFVVIDDMDLGELHSVRTDPMVGFSKEDLTKSLQMLGHVETLGIAMEEVCG